MATNTGQFVFFDSSSTDLESNPYGIGANGGACITLQFIPDDSTVTDISADNIKVFGCVDMTKNEYRELKAISLKSFKTYNTITVPDIFMVICSGVNYVKLTRDSVTIPLKAFAISVD